MPRNLGSSQILLIQLDREGLGIKLRKYLLLRFHVLTKLLKVPLLISNFLANCLLVGWLRARTVLPQLCMKASTLFEVGLWSHPRPIGALAQNARDASGCLVIREETL